MSDALAPYQRMALNNAWANATLYGALRGMEPQAFQAERPGFFPSLCDTLNHIYEVDLFYLDALEQGGLGRSVYERDLVTDVSELAGLQADADMRLAGFCHKNAAEILEEPRQVMRRDGPVTEQVDALLLHLFQHQIHHRGQAHVQLQSAGIDPPQLDEFHLEDGRAASAKPYF